jgi:hypothetical protein
MCVQNSGAIPVVIKYLTSIRLFGKNDKVYKMDPLVDPLQTRGRIHHLYVLKIVPIMHAHQMDRPWIG